MEEGMVDSENFNGRRTSSRRSTVKLSFKEKFTRQPIFRERILFTASICWSFIMLGWVESLFGPTLPDLRLIINETLDTASWLFTATSGGFLVGSLVTGVLYDRFNRTLLLFFSILGTSGTVAAIPWCPYFALMLFVKFLGGVMAASLDTGGNAEVVSIWDKHAAPYMQALHFCFSLGGMIAPLVARPFLATDASDKPTNASSLGPYKNISKAEAVIQIDTQSEQLNLTNISYSTSDQDMESVETETRVQYAYLISAILILVTALPFLCMYYIKKDEMAKSRKADQRKKETDFDKLTLMKKILILCLLAMLMVVYCGTEDTFAGFLMTFTITQLHWTKSAGSIATSVHWISFGFARLGAIFVVRFIQTTKLLYIFSTMLIVSFACLLFATLMGLTPLVWIFIGSSGFSMSVIFPAIFTWTNEHVVPVSGKISAMFLMSSSLGVMLFPLLFGYTMDNFSPIWFLYLLIGQSVLLVVIYTAAVLVTKCFIKSPLNTLELSIEEKEPMNIEMI